MLQRIQTIYLLIATVFYFIYWFFGLEWYEKGYSIISNIFNDTDYVYNILIVISYIPVLISLICLVAIFMFKNRELQIKLSRLGFGLSLFMSLFTVFYFYACLNSLIDLMPSKFIELLMYTAIINPFICSYLIHLAKNSIKKDNELISSLDRIR